MASYRVQRIITNLLLYITLFQRTSKQTKNQTNKKERESKKKKKKKKKNSPTGNRTRVFRVTGGDTYHYTIEDKRKFLPQNLVINLIT